MMPLAEMPLNGSARPLRSYSSDMRRNRSAISVALDCCAMACRARTAAGISDETNARRVSNAGSREARWLLFVENIHTCNRLALGVGAFYSNSHGLSVLRYNDPTRDRFFTVFAVPVLPDMSADALRCNSVEGTFLGRSCAT